MQGDWPTQLFDAQKARFYAALGPRLETEVKPLQDKINSLKHPWNKISLAIFLSGGFWIYGGIKIWDYPIFPGLAIIGCILFGALFKARKRNLVSTAAQAELGRYMQNAIGIDIYDVNATHSHILQTFSQAGFLGHYDSVRYLQGLGPKTSTGPQTIGTHLTRTETETYTDSDGNRSTRNRTIQVFEGLMLEMDIEGFDSDNRILITSRATQRCYGPFARSFNGKRQKMDQIKTSSLDFNKAYDVITDDQTLAHLFLDPVRVMRLNNLYDDLGQILSQKRPRISVLITQSRAWIALETDGVPNLDYFSGNPVKFDREVGEIIGQAALPHIIAEHLEWPNPMPYAWQDYISHV